jgi:tol-pal system protein YbgF
MLNCIFRKNLALALLSIGGVLIGQAQAQEMPVQGAPASAAEPASTSSRQLSELFYQIQVLQQEVQELRGLVEEQAYQLNRLARDQKEQYIDLDRRVAGLTTGAAAGAGLTAGSSTPPAAGTASGSPGSVGGGQASTSPATSGAVAALPAAGGVSEREAYQSAFDLMKGRKFDESIAAFNDLIVRYPNGQYTPNAFYWLGELHLAQQNTEQARQSFMQVIGLYPDHPKVPDTLYKLGVAYHRLGDTAKAMEYFEDVQSRYPQSSAAGLAASYEQELR